jgi:hypothetical protein
VNAIGENAFFKLNTATGAITAYSTHVANTDSYNNLYIWVALSPTTNTSTLSKREPF